MKVGNTFFIEIVLRHTQNSPHAISVIAYSALERPRYIPLSSATTLKRFRTMATPRRQLIDPDHPMHDSIVTRCVRGSRLCGVDRRSRTNYAHRKGWLAQRMCHLVKHFSVAVDAFTIMNSRFHLVVHFDHRQAIDSVMD
ncbi:MAG: hypothetical protein QNL15_04290, partial [Pseudomonadales bacterium]